MSSNNILIFTFGLMFLILGFLQPIINQEFNNPYTTNDISIIEDVGQQDINNTSALDFLGAVFFWVFGAPVWLNILLTMLRVIFWIIVYDKFRGLG